MNCLHCNKKDDNFPATVTASTPKLYSMEKIQQPFSSSHFLLFLFLFLFSSFLEGFRGVCVVWLHEFGGRMKRGQQLSMFEKGVIEV